jgi:hypothetical protein
MFGEPDYQLVDRTMRRLGDLGVKVDLSEVDMPVFLEGDERCERGGTSQWKMDLEQGRVPDDLPGAEDGTRGVESGQRQTGGPVHGRQLHDASS